MINHEEAKVNTALGLTDEAYKKLVSLVQEELFRNKRISNLIANSMVRIKEEEFGLDNVEENTLSNYELKLVLAGVYIERATSHPGVLFSHFDVMGDQE